MKKKTNLTKAEQWYQKYYPCDPQDCKKADAIKHSLRKWRGLRKSILDKHDMELDGTKLMDLESSLYIDADSCALCYWYSEDGSVDYCQNCPIVKATGTTCDGFTGNYEPSNAKDSPWGIFSETGNPEPMIEVLEKALKLQQKKAKKKK